MSNKIRKYVVDTDNQFNFLKSVILKGTCEIGSGCFATVYAPPKYSYVIKEGSLNDPYLDYAFACLRARTFNPFLPRIHKIIIVETNADDWFCPNNYFVIMEKLKPLSRDQIRKVERHENNQDYEDIQNMVRAFYAKRYTKRIDRFLKSALQTIKRSPSGEPDFHAHNIMIRNNNQLVITDPLC